MRFHFFSYFLALGLSLLSLPSVAGDSKDDGGNVSYSVLKKDLFEHRQRLVRLVEANAEALIRDGWFSEAELVELLDLYQEVPLALVYKQLYVEVTDAEGQTHMVPVDAVNNKDKFYIRVNAYSWGLLDQCQKSKLLLHEYATLLGKDKSLDNSFSGNVAALFMKECYEMIYKMDSIDSFGFGWPQPSSGSMVY